MSKRKGDNKVSKDDGSELKIPDFLKNPTPGFDWKKTERENIEDKAAVIERVSDGVLDGDTENALGVLERLYPFQSIQTEKRSYTIDQKMGQFIKDGFIDRYSGERLVNPGMLKVLSILFPKEFPYHPHWKTTETHQAYWELSPTIDHIVPIANGGADEENNWVTTSMLRNSIKSSWTLEQLQWELHPVGSIDDWDGLTKKFIGLVEKNEALLEDDYIKRWYNASKKSFDEYGIIDNTIFELKQLASYGAIGDDGGYSVTLRDDGTLIYSRYEFGKDKPISTEIMGKNYEMVQEVRKIIEQHFSEIKDIPDDLNNDSCDGTLDYLRFGTKRISALNISMTNPKKAPENTEYEKRFYENMLHENKVLEIYDEIAKVISSYHLGVKMISAKKHGFPAAKLTA